MLFKNVFIIFVLFLCVKSKEQRRLILHSADDIAQEFQVLRNEIEALKANHTKEIQSLKNIQAQEIKKLTSVQAQEISSLTYELTKLTKDQGSTYVRWGRTTCEGNETEEVYSGFTAGSPYSLNGGAASYVCLPRNPNWAKYVDGRQNIGGKISGTEYETKSFTALALGMQDQDAPCVVCRSPRLTTIMVPGRTNCYSGWTMEYTGYLMTGHYTQTGGTDYACVDKDPEAVYHGEADQDGKLFYFTEVNCGSLPCQEYPDGRELACAVCSK